MAGKFVANIDDIRPQYAFSDQISQSAIFSSKLVRTAAVPVGATVDDLDSIEIQPDT